MKSAVLVAECGSFAANVGYCAGQPVPEALPVLDTLLVSDTGRTGVRHRCISILLLLLLFMGGTARLDAQTDLSKTDTQKTDTTQKTNTEKDEAAEKTPATALVPNAQLALSTPDYLVTAGDIYTLAYFVGSSAVESSIMVDSSYRIRIANLGMVEAAGKTFNQLKTQVETIVSTNYPLGSVQFVLRQPAVFKVYIRGEVQNPREMQAWALLRLSTMLEEDNLTPYSSIRNVQIRSSNGQVRTYDLFQATRASDLSQNPFVRPDDIITVNRFERSVTIKGAVERPGTYQILRGENLRELINRYGNGFAPTADPSRMELERYINRNSLAGDKIMLDEQDITDNFALENYDVLSVPNIINLRPVLFVEGAVQSLESDSTETVENLRASNRLIVVFNQGETYGALVRRSAGWFSAVSDTQNAYIIRGNTHIPINLNPLLYDAGYRSDIEIKENDTLIVPFRQYFVSVAGAVYAPGRYPYIPDRDWEYYIGLAGGFTENNAGDTITIIDMNGKKMSKGDPIVPETTITAQSNSFLYGFNRFAPVVTTILSIISTTLVLMTSLGVFN
ncbi:MAG: SLBB domain-containing protein [Treponema sp.]|nr:SLBB domain-containing protein [Treponema sp.]